VLVPDTLSLFVLSPCTLVEFVLLPRTLGGVDASAIHADTVAAPATHGGFGGAASKLHRCGGCCFYARRYCRW
jgi:hypothetical protein